MLIKLKEMKMKKFFGILLLSVLLFFIGCSEDDNPAVSNASSSINGVWISNFDYIASSLHFEDNGSFKSILSGPSLIEITTGAFQANNYEIIINSDLGNATFLWVINQNKLTLTVSHQNELNAIEEKLTQNVWEKN